MAASAGVSIPITLPLIGMDSIIRTQDEIVDRLLTGSALAAVAYGLDPNKAYRWLCQEKLEDVLLESERRFLDGHDSESLSFKVQVEGMWTLAWSLQLVKHIDFWKDCDPGFVLLLPNLKAGDSSEMIRSSASLRSSEEILAECDLAYCLHWAIRQAELVGLPAPTNLKPYVVIERRRALEWLFCNAPWDAIPLDT